MIYMNNNYNFTVAAFGRKQSGKTTFLMSLLDRNDIEMTDVFENEDYYKVSYRTLETGVMNLYVYTGFENNLAFIDELMYELSPSFTQMDYVLYFINSIKEITEFDRRFISRLNDKQVMVFCIFNKRTKEEVNKTQLYIEQGYLKVNSYFCNCTNRFEVMTINDVITKLCKDEILLYDITQHVLESPKTVMFLDPITLASTTKNIYAKYYNILKSTVNKNGIGIYINKERLQAFLGQGNAPPDILVTGDKILLGVKDFTSYFSK